jgi:hypothetical protein
MSVIRVVSDATAGRSGLTCLLLAAAVMLCACTVARLSGDDTNDAGDPRNPQPANYRSDILAMLRVYLNNPTEIRDAGISAPMLMRVGPRDRYVVCLRLNAKKGDGGYVGSKDYAAVFVAGRLDQLIDARQEQCGAAEFQPFPEAEKLGR